MEEGQAPKFSPREGGGECVGDEDAEDHFGEEGKQVLWTSWMSWEDSNLSVDGSVVKCCLLDFSFIMRRGGLGFGESFWGKEDEFPGRRGC